MSVVLCLSETVVSIMSCVLVAAGMLCTTLALGSL